ncbi:hypothetical protein MMC12_008591 [Toensbergia leucococca]|nr:hypothetical protein [Toensbergia leucococca]
MANSVNPNDSYNPPITPSTPTNRNSGDVGTRSRASSGTSGRLRSASFKFLDSAPPSGMWAATAEAAAAAPSLADIRTGSYGASGWEGDGQRRNSLVNEENVRRLSRIASARSTSSRTQRPSLTPNIEVDESNHNDSFPPSAFLGRGEMNDQVFVRQPKGINRRLDEEMDDDAAPDSLEPSPKAKAKAEIMADARTSDSFDPASMQPGRNPSFVYPNGYKPPKNRSCGESTLIGLKAFGRYSITPVGALVVFYGLNVVAWGGMLFLLLIGGAPKMCYPAHLHGIKSCNDIDSPRRIWIETDSQILNALFCVTGFGLIPWRFRDFWFLMKYRLQHKEEYLRRLAGIHNGWYRLPESDELPLIPTDPENNPAVPLPTSKASGPPLTGIRAPPTAWWKLDYVIWGFMANTALQACLSGFMWGLNRYNRPSWSTGLFVALACIVAAMAGLMMFNEGKKVKKVEGVPVPMDELVVDEEMADVGKEKKRWGKK